MNHEELIPQQDASLKTPKKDLVKSAKDFLENTFGGKAPDLHATIEQFTAEMTLVAEGLSEDQDRLSQLSDQLHAQQTAFEQQTLDQFHDVSVSLQELNQRMDQMETRLDKLQKQATDKKLKKTDGLTALVRQCTYLVGILCAAWIITTLIQFFK